MASALKVDARVLRAVSTWAYNASTHAQAIRFIMRRVAPMGRVSTTLMDLIVYARKVGA